jgi:hypothetical protein
METYTIIGQLKELGRRIGTSWIFWKSLVKSKIF